MNSPDADFVQAASPVLAKSKLRTARGRLYEPAIGTRLRILLAVIFASVALLGATGAYLLAIRWLEYFRELTYTNQFTLGMFMVHVLLGVFLIIPFLLFGMIHLATARRRPNRVAVRLGIALFTMGILVGLTGLALIQLEKLPQLPTGTSARYLVYTLHIVTPLLAVVLYVQHRRAGPAIQWRWGIGWGFAVGLFVIAMCVMHAQDPRRWYVQGPQEGEKYFEPSKTRTADGNFISAEVLMMDDYCLKCHKDIYDGWFHSAHHLSSFNNPPYLFSVRETRKVSLQRDGNVRAARWCAGCHDVVPFVSGAFDDPNFDDVNHPTARAGITCTVCHAITNINSTIGNGDYTIEEPQHYPLAFSQNAWLQWINNQVVKAKPDFHKKTFLKPLHRTAEFCSTCHKVSIPAALNHYKEFLRGQNHYDTYLLSGVSGVGARSFYYPPQAKTNCAECHMPLLPSADFGGKDYDGSGERKIHHHGFPGANTGLPSLVAREPAEQAHAESYRRAVGLQSDFLRGTDPAGKDQKLRMDLFGLKEGGTIDGALHAPLRPLLPHLKPGGSYLIEVVIRTLNVGHPFPQGTADSNEIWVDFLARSGDRIIGRSGALSGPGESGQVDEWSHFVNVLMLDRDGRRINRRNPQDIFTPLYDHQIPPGAAQVVHYKLEVPKDVQAPIELQVKLRYRKFDYEYMGLVYKDAGSVPQLPIVDVCEDRLVLPVEGVTADIPEQPSPVKPAWQRWNDYGIGCLLEGGAGQKKGELRQAEEAFRLLTTLEEPEARAHGYLNVSRVLLDEGRLREAVEALSKAQETKPSAPWWTIAWFTGLVNAQNGNLDGAIADFERILDPANQPRERKFDFGRDYVVIGELGSTLFKRAQQEDRLAERDAFLRRAAAAYERVLKIDAEDLDAHYGLAQCFARLSESMPSLAATNPSGAVDEARLLLLAKSFADGNARTEQRLQTAADLSWAITKFGQQPLEANHPKLPALLAIIQQCRPICDEASEENIRTAAAKVLAQAYRQSHAILKPDDNAKDRAVRIYREAHRAAAEASQAIVIYPLNRR
jgi:tetratricopeptide (TPR) repeat protein